MTPLAPKVPTLLGAPKPPSRMTISNVKRGVGAVPWFILLYGDPKLGKSTFAAGAPSPVWIDLDGGSEGLDVARFPKPRTFTELREALDEVARNGIANGFKTLVVDPLAYIEPLIANDVTGGALVNTKTWGGGFGAYENAIRDRVRLFFSDVERVHTAGLNVMLIGHSKVKKFEDPEGPAFDRYELDVESKELAGKTIQTVQAILFAKKEAYGKIDPTTKKAKAAGAGLHVLCTTGTAAYRAGNRWSLPPTMPLSWDHFASAMANREQRRAELIAQIEAGLVAINNPETTAKVRQLLAEGRDPADVHNAVASKLADLAAAAEIAEGFATPNEETTNETNEETNQS